MRPGASSRSTATVSIGNVITHRMPAGAKSSLMSPPGLPRQATLNELGPEALTLGRGDPRPSALRPLDQERFRPRS